MKKIDEKGQALIELIVFLPLMFTLYSVISGFASSISGSINQQKITRAYFYYRVQNNSTIPKPDFPDKTFESWGRFGMFYIGWKDFFNGQVPVMPCYRVSIPLKAATGDNCKSVYTEPETLYTRVGTVYGMCGATYRTQNRRVFPVPDGAGMVYQELVDVGSCLISR